MFRGTVVDQRRFSDRNHVRAICQDADRAARRADHQGGQTSGLVLVDDAAAGAGDRAAERGGVGERGDDQPDRGGRRSRRRGEACRVLGCKPHALGVGAEQARRDLVRRLDPADPRDVADRRDRARLRRRDHDDQLAVERCARCGAGGGELLDQVVPPRARVIRRARFDHVRHGGVRARREPPARDAQRRLDPTAAGDIDRDAGEPHDVGRIEVLRVPGAHHHVALLVVELDRDRAVLARPVVGEHREHERLERLDRLRTRGRILGRIRRDPHPQLVRRPRPFVVTWPRGERGEHQGSEPHTA
jgi:hypothetical protein